MRYQFIRIVWNEEKKIPQMYLRDLSTDRYITKNFNKKIKLIKQDTKICIGHHNYETKINIPCDKQVDLTGSRYDRCFTCNELDGFKSCLLCRGKECNVVIDHVKNYCATPHIVYLTYFGQGKFKVGTTSYKRKNIRLLEQGATESLIIATGTGMQVRDLEDEIGKLGYYTNIQPSYKLKNLIYTKNHKAENLLRDEYDKIKEKLEDKFSMNFLEAQYIHFDTLIDLKDELPKTQSQLSLFSTEAEEKYQYNIYDNNIVQGEYLGAIGSIIVFKNKLGVNAINLKKWYGYIIEL